ncbi:alpha/beta hydrolase [Bifidobacterium pseudolongum]|uniref:alpha/beta hydrolase n=1 Tax=Bifidobacterium pseudolongum TaxID=1694 RepID=UPI00102162AD|nr:alpha/beta hydrolase-fold protein [Bifidobacterium pseudolongum]RYQ31313.1 esterase [Bifidobacterium pseudolongum subsp. globosum]
MVQATGWDAVYQTRITHGWLPYAVWAMLGVGLVALAAAQIAAGKRRNVVKQAVAALVCACAGGAITWFISDGIVLFGVELGWEVIGAAAGGFFLAGAFIAAAVMTRGWKRVLAIAMVPLTVLGAGLRINAIYGEFQTVGSLVDYSPYPPLESAHVSRATVSVAQWNAQVRSGSVRPETEGKLFNATIPATRSGFRARHAVVWLPPAALAAHPPVLPVLVMLSGQPGSPSRFFGASNAVAVLTRYAREHNGLAPIVVSPDQNTGMMTNSLCADTTKVGKAQTYLTQDVPDWIRATLPASGDATDWVIGGFSQGATCSTQLAPNFPTIYGNVLAVDGELAPTAGSRQSMINDYFGGDEAAYDRQVPVNAIKAHAPSRQVMILGAGARDHTSLANVVTIGEAAREAGWTVHMVKAAGSGHDWRAVNATFAVALPWLCDRMGLDATPAAFEDYAHDHAQKVEVLQ